MNFTLAQAVLLVLIAGVVAYSLMGRSVSRDRALLLVLAAVGGLLVLWPGLSTSVARMLGVGRGADLVFYLFAVFCLFRFVSIAADKRQLDERLTRVGPRAGAPDGSARHRRTRPEEPGDPRRAAASSSPGSARPDRVPRACTLRARRASTPSVLRACHREKLLYLIVGGWNTLFSYACFAVLYYLLQGVVVLRR